MKDIHEAVQTGKPYNQLTDQERKQIVGFTPQQHADLKAQYGKRLHHITVRMDEEERYDYLIVRPGKDILLAMASHKDDLTAANNLLINNCVKAGDMEALEDAAVYTSVLAALSQLIAGQAAFISKA